MFQGLELFLIETSNVIAHRQRLDMEVENDSFSSLPLRI